MKLAIMQPYFFPYLAYFQLVNTVDKFVFYDDVQYIKGGWINRNKILVSNKENIITLSLVSSSPNKKINEIKISNGYDKVLRKIAHSYQKAPFFKKVFPIVEEVFNAIDENSLISEIAAFSVILVSKFMSIEVDFEFSSKCYYNTRHLGRTERLVEICKLNNADTYINPKGGSELYTKDEFNKHNISLFFISTFFTKYNQFNNKIFIPNLSIIDVMMFNSPAIIKKILDEYELQ